MKIKTLLHLSSLFVVILALLVSAVVYLATRNTQLMAAQGATAEKLIQQVFELNALAQEYVRGYSERPRVQWYAQYDNLHATMLSPVLQEEPSRAVLGDLRRDMEGMKTSFDRLMLLSAQEKDQDGIEAQFSADLLVKTRRLIQSADALVQRTFQEQAAARMRADALIFLMLACLALAAVGLMALCYRRVVGSLTALQKGVSIIGEGDLSYKVGSDKPDEIGELSRAFDDMSSKLKHSYDSLELKVEERTKEIRQAKEKNEILLHSIGDAVVAIDKDWNIVMWNPIATLLTGWGQEEAMGKPFRSFVKFLKEQDRSENILFISEAMLTRRVKNMENHTVLIRKDGSELPVGDSAAPIIDPTTNEVDGAIIVFRDVSADRDAQLIRSSFAYASHQLRTPVTEALWSIEVAKDEVKQGPAKEKIEIAFNSMKSVQKLVSELMDVSELEQGTIVPKLSEVKIEQLYKDLKKTVADKAKRHKIKLNFIKPKQDLVITVDLKLLVKALYEVIDNAIIYSPANASVRIEATLHQEEIVLLVQDKGIGIPVEQQSLIFTKFFRGQNIPLGSVGAGLGLYISQSIVRLLKGKIWFKSDGRSTTSFFISVPLASTQAPSGVA